MLFQIILTLNSLRRTDLAALLALVLGLVVAVILIISQIYENRGNFSGGGKTPVPIIPKKVKGISNIWLHLVAYVMIVIYALPLIIVIAFSFAPGTSIGSEVFPSSFTLSNYTKVFSSADKIKPLINSITMSIIAIIVTISLVLFVMSYVTKKKTTFAKVLDFSFVLPWMIPNPLIAIGLILAFSLPSIFIGGATLLGTYAILPIGFIVISLPLCARVLRAAHIGIDPSLEEAARSMGASGFYRYRKIILPIILPTIILTAAMQFTDLFAEYPVSAFLYNINNKPLSIAIVDGSLNSDPEAKAINLVYVAIMMVISMIVVIFADRKGLGSKTSSE